ncbi:unnamed protein product [Musa acuminata subsp. burmannicoides]
MAFVDADKLSYEIFSVLESKFLFGLDDPNKLFFPLPPTPQLAPPRTAAGAEEGSGSCPSTAAAASDALLAAVALARLVLPPSPFRRPIRPRCLHVRRRGRLRRRRRPRRDALYQGPRRSALFSATDALHLLLSEPPPRRSFSPPEGLFRGMFRRPGVSSVGSSATRR